jgi:hypothetical protein
MTSPFTDGQSPLSVARKQVEVIRHMAGDPEAAHGAEDSLWADTLRYFAEVAPAELAELARIVLSTEEIDFPRWCA